MAVSPFSQTFAELPPSLPIFPLAGAVVMPGSYLPLNIFEPRYLNMISDAMRADQLIGMIQPISAKVAEPTTDLFSVGSCGRIVQYEETLDGRLNVVLNGLCRFKVEREISTTRGYRRIVPNWNDYERDFETETKKPPADFEQLKILLKRYIDDNSFDPKWKEVVDTVDPGQVVSNAVSYLPFGPQDKQLLLETNSFAELVSATIAVMQTHEAGATRH